MKLRAVKGRAMFSDTEGYQLADLPPDSNGATIMWIPGSRKYLLAATFVGHAGAPNKLFDTSTKELEEERKCRPE